MSLTKRKKVKKPRPALRIYLYGYKRGSSSLKLLQKAFTQRLLPCVRRQAGTTKPPRAYDKLICWGSTPPPTYKSGINSGISLSYASNKLETFKKLAEHSVSCPEFTTDRNIAAAWLPDYWIVCRKLLRSSGGKGIVLAKTPEEIVNAPLYVKYMRKQQEFRVHVFKGTIIDVQEKRRKQGSETYNKYLRNYDAGWVFCRENIVAPDGLNQLASAACSALGLDFGAVDIVYNQKKDKLYVLEINSAPGLEGTTIDKYVEAILNA